MDTTTLGLGLGLGLSLQQLESIQLRNLTTTTTTTTTTTLHTYIQLSLPNQTTRTELTNIKTEPQTSSTNPTFYINLPQSYHHPTLFNPFTNSSFIQLDLHAIPSQPTSSTPPPDPDRPFPVVMTWLIDFDRLLYLAKNESEIYSLLSNGSLSTPSTPNELYLCFRNGVYLFQPAPFDLHQELQSIELHPNHHQQDQSQHMDLHQHISTDLPSNTSPAQSKHLKLWVLDDLIKYMEKKVELEQTLEAISKLEWKFRRKMSIGVADEGGEEADEGEEPTAASFNLFRNRSQIQQTLKSLDSLQTSADIHLIQLQDQLRERKAQVTKRRREIETAHRRLADLIRTNLTESRERLRMQEWPKKEKCGEGLSGRRSELIVDLSTIYPIEPTLKNPTEASSSLLLFSIAGVILPNLEPTSHARGPHSAHRPAGFIQLFHYTHPQTLPRDDLALDDSIVSTALGFISHLISLVSAYLNVPLVYPVSFFGSRSSVSDFVSRIHGPRSFPLYFKGVDRFRFEYGVFLLNKNIEQIMHHQKVIVSDLRQTLPNLKNLFLTLEPNPASLATAEGTSESSRGVGSADGREKRRPSVEEPRGAPRSGRPSASIRSLRRSRSERFSRDDAAPKVLPDPPVLPLSPPTPSVDAPPPAASPTASPPPRSPSPPPSLAIHPLPPSHLINIHPLHHPSEKSI